jgi:hypothetical protein
VKVQALAQGQGQKMYVVPKHYGRNEQNVFNNLKKSKNNLFISYDKTQLDTSTSNELKYLNESGKRVYAIVPNNMNMTSNKDNQSHFHTFSYSQNNQIDFAQSIQKFIIQLENDEKVRQKKKELNVLVVVGVLLLSILLLGLIVKNDKE